MVIYGWLDYFMHNVCLRLYSFFTLILISGFAYAQAIPYSNTVSVTPVAVRSATITSTGTVLQNIEFKASKAANQSSFFTRAVEFNKPTTAMSVKAFAKRNAAGLGLTALTLAIGWSLDEITKDIYPALNNGSSPAISCNPYYSVGGNIFGAGQGCSPATAVQGWRNNCLYWGGRQGRTNPVCNITPMFTSNGSPASISPYVVTYNDYGYPASLSGNEASSISQGTYNQPAQPANVSPATDTQISDSLVPALSPQALNKLHTDPVSGAIVNTQEVVNKATEVANEYNKAIDPNSAPETAPIVSNQTAIDTAINSNPTSTSQVQQPLAFPEFCTWAESVCALKDWAMQPFTDTVNYELPVNNITVEPVVYTSGLGDGTCPQPMVVNLVGNSIPFTFQPMCTFAQMISYLLIFGAYFMSVSILIGVKK